MMKNFVVSDSNIFIDLFETGILVKFFELPWEIHTTNTIVKELKNPGIDVLLSAQIVSGRLNIHIVDDNIQASLPQSSSSGVSSRLSLQDYSALYVSYSEGYMLLTGDRRLKRRAESLHVEVHGILYVIKAMYDARILPAEIVLNVLNDLSSTNRRLPAKEISQMRSQLKTIISEDSVTKEFIDSYAGVWAGEEYQCIEDSIRRERVNRSSDIDNI